MAAHPNFEISREFWKGRRVFVTGHTGFKGTWLLVWLRSLGAVVRGYSLAPPSEPSLFESIEAQELCDHQIGDIRDAASLSAAIRDHQPEIVFHLAAQSLVLDSYEQPISTLDVNIMGTAHVLEALRWLSSVKSVVVVTSDKCYRNLDEPRAFAETDPLGGHDPYSASKACAEIVASSYRDSFLKSQGVGVATARAGNVFGGGDWAKNRIVPDAMRSFAAAQALFLRRPGAVRPWQHVLEPLSGYLLLARALVEAPAEYCDAWNFGPDGSEIFSVADVARDLARFWGAEAQIEGAAQSDVAAQWDGPKEAQLLTVDASKACARLGWSSRLPHSEALRWTVEWYRTHHQGATATQLRELLEQQIVNYCAVLDHTALGDQAALGDPA